MAWLYLGPHGEESDEDEDQFEEVEISTTPQSKAKGKQVNRKSIQPRARKPANPVFAMLGEEILKDDPTYTGGTRVKLSSVNVTKHRGASPERKEPSVERDVATPSDEESREGTFSLSLSVSL